MFQVALILYVQNQKNELLYASVRKTNDICLLPLIGAGTSKETLLHTSIQTFAELTGMFLNPIRFKPLMCSVTVPIIEITGNVSDENILMIPKYYMAVHLPRPIENVSSQDVSFHWVNYDTMIEQYDYLIDKYALWELHHRLITNKSDILPNYKQTRPKYFKR